MKYNYWGEGLVNHLLMQRFCPRKKLTHIKELMMDEDPDEEMIVVGPVINQTHNTMKWFRIHIDENNPKKYGYDSREQLVLSWNELFDSRTYYGIEIENETRFDITPVFTRMGQT